MNGKRRVRGGSTQNVKNVYKLKSGQTEIQALYSFSLCIQSTTLIYNVQLQQMKLYQFNENYI